MVGADAGGHIRVQIHPPHPGGVAVDRSGRCGPQLGEDVIICRQNASKVHHFRQTQHPLVLQQALEIVGGELGAGAFQRAGRYA